jgi:hypothetical protein
MSDNQIINGSHVALIALIVLGTVAVLIGLILGIQALIKNSEKYDIFVARPLEQSGVNRLDWRTNAKATCSRIMPRYQDLQGRLKIVRTVRLHM